MLWWMLKLVDGDWMLDQAVRTTPSPASKDDPSIIPEEHLHLDDKKQIVGAEVLAMTLSQAISRAEDLREAAARFAEGITKDEIVLRWYDHTGKTVIHEERLYDTGIWQVVNKLGCPHELGLKREIEHAIHAARFRRVDYRTKEVSPPTVVGIGERRDGARKEDEPR
jgi:hypothetical protein